MDTEKYIDLQVNGYAGVDFNHDALSEDAVHFACERLREDGVAGILATVITDELPRMEARLARIAEICRRDSLADKVICGIHVEGPFLNETPGYVGAHPVSAVRPADLDSLRRLLDAADGRVRMVTLAPERDQGNKAIRYLADHNILVSAGHCDPSLDELRAAIDAGLSIFTHLGNGCPMLLPRHDNVIQRVLSQCDRLTICFIGDGVHIPAATLGNYLQLVGIEQAIIVTDAISAARLGPGRYTLGPQSVVIGDDRVARSTDDSHLVGSTATMPQMAAILREKLGLSEDAVRRLLFENPRRVLRNVMKF